MNIFAPKVAFALCFAVLALVPMPSRAENITITIFPLSGTNGNFPRGQVMQARDGNFYGTCRNGGATTNADQFGSAGYGCVYKMTPDGTITALASFYGTNGMHPWAGLVEGDDGNLYGTTYDGGAYPGTGAFGGPGAGTIFRVTPTGTLTTLLSFWATNGANPVAGLTKGPDGVLYGTTRSGGSGFGDPSSSNSFGCGTLFKITTNGNFTSLYSFTCGLDGYWPFENLTLASDGNFYGLISVDSPGLKGDSRVFRLSPDGVVTAIAPANALIGSCTGNPLIETRDGQLCGASFTGGTNQLGGVYQVSLSGAETMLTSFTESGACFGSVVQGTDGSIYGVRGNATVVRIRLDGSYETLLSLSSKYFISGLIQGRDGNLYGTGGGYDAATQAGFVFRVSVASVAAPKLAPPSKSGNSVGLSWSAIPGRTYQLQVATSLVGGVWTNVPGTVVASGSVTGATDPAAADGSRFYRVVMLP